MRLGFHQIVPEFSKEIRPNNRNHKLRLLFQQPEPLLDGCRRLRLQGFSESDD